MKLTSLGGERSGHLGEACTDAGSRGPSGAAMVLVSGLGDGGTNLTLDPGQERVPYLAGRCPESSPPRCPPPKVKTTS